MTKKNETVAPEESTGLAESPKVPDQSTAIAKPVKMGVGLSRERRAALIAKIVEPSTMAKLKGAYETFFGALASPDLAPEERMVLASYGITQLTESLGGEILDNIIVPLMNTPAGFGTDKDPSRHESWMSKPPATPYSKEIVLKCAVQAILHGLPLTGGAFNIIAGGMYPRKEGYEFLVSSVCKYSIAVDVPPITGELFQQGGYLKVPVKIQYRLHTDPKEEANRHFNSTYSVRLNKKNAVGVEACEGKAKRKALRDLWGALSGVLLADADDLHDTEAKVHQVGAHHGETNVGAKPMPSASDLSSDEWKNSAPGEAQAASKSSGGPLFDEGK